jgi:hypothetical protein
MPLSIRFVHIPKEDKNHLCVKITFDCGDHTHEGYIHIRINTLWVCGLTGQKYVGSDNTFLISHLRGIGKRLNRQVWLGTIPPINIHDSEGSSTPLFRIEYVDGEIPAISIQKVIAINANLPGMEVLWTYSTRDVCEHNILDEKDIGDSFIGISNLLRDLESQSQVWNSSDEKNKTPGMSRKDRKDLRAYKRKKNVKRRNARKQNQKANV